MKYRVVSVDHARMLSRILQIVSDGCADCGVDVATSDRVAHAVAQRVEDEGYVLSKQISA